MVIKKNITLLDSLRRVPSQLLNYSKDTKNNSNSYKESVKRNLHFPQKLFFTN